MWETLICSLPCHDRGTQMHYLGMCPEGESNLQPSGLGDTAQPTGQGTSVTIHKVSYLWDFWRDKKKNWFCKMKRVLEIDCTAMWMYLSLPNWHLKMIKLMNLYYMYFTTTKKKSYFIKLTFYFLNLAALSEASRSFNQSIFYFLISDTNFTLL